MIETMRLRIYILQIIWLIYSKTKLKKEGNILELVNPNRFGYIYLSKYNNYCWSNFLYNVSWTRNFIFVDDENWITDNLISANVFKKEIEERFKYFGTYQH